MKLTLLKFIAAGLLTAVITTLVALYGADVRIIVSVFFIVLCFLITIFTLAEKVSNVPEKKTKEVKSIDLTKPNF